MLIENHHFRKPLIGDISSVFAFSQCEHTPRDVYDCLLITIKLIIFLYMRNESNSLINKIVLLFIFYTTCSVIRFFSLHQYYVTYQIRHNITFNNPFFTLPATKKEPLFNVTSTNAVSSRRPFSIFLFLTRRK